MTDVELRDVAYGLLYAACKAIAETQVEIERLNTRLSNLEDNIRVSMDIIEGLNQKEVES